MASGVPIDVFAREIGLTTKDLTWLAAREGRKLEGQPALLWDRVMNILNHKLGEIIDLRNEIDRREERTRRRKIASKRRG